MKNKKVGFIYLDELHHIHHFLSPAVELSKLDEIDVEILTYDAKHEYLEQMIKNVGGKNLKIVRLSTYLYRKISEKIKKRNKPSALYIYKKHKRRFLSYDALVLTDHTADVIIKAKQNAGTPKLIHLAHGSGDGVYGYHKAHKYYDLIITAGEKKTKRLIKEQKNKNLNIKICGYSKFDFIDIAGTPINFKNKKPIVLYTPHFKKELSSWYSWGLTILEFFINQSEYNLIFAPHINLFNKKGFEVKDSIKQKFFDAPNLYIDLGSTNSVDMTYTKVSDIYLGDVSSQVYEFMFKTRPLIFLNAHNIDWKNDSSYLIWKAGKVISTLDDLPEAIKTAKKWAKKFNNVQKQLFDQTYNLIEEKSGSRVARAIVQEVNMNL